MPSVLGHEFRDDVMETGADVTCIRTGDRAAVNAIDACRRCFFCRRARYALCPEAAYIGFRRDGGYAASDVVPAELLRAAAGGILPRQISGRADVGGAARRAQYRLEIGSSVAVCTLQCLLATGACKVHVIETAAGRRHFAAENGARSVWVHCTTIRRPA